MYEQSIPLCSSNTAESDTMFILVPGTVGANAQRRKAVGSSISGLPASMDIKGEILAPSGNRKYSVLRVSIVINETRSDDAAFGSSPVLATSLSFNIPFGTVDAVELPFSAAVGAAHRQLYWLLQYIAPKTFLDADTIKFSELVGVTTLISALGSIADGVR